MNLEIKTEIKGMCCFVRVKGEIYLYSSPKFRKAILILIKKKIPKIVVNLKNVTYMDTSCIATLVERFQKINKYKGHLMLVGLCKKVEDVFELTRLATVFEIHKDFKVNL